jgi:alkanesulfonate monooxygenase SsuD/methylene tetrahydromethanopterin reductase-like flavin-dependent oxidoreductase (luciferase family)
VQGHVPVLLGAGGTEKNFQWLVQHADGWITTPREVEIDEQVAQLQRLWSEAGRAGAPEVVALAVKPERERIDHLASIGVTECAFGLPDRSPDEVEAYLDRLAGRLGLA